MPPLVFTVCRGGPKCSLKYHNDWLQRVRDRGPEGQGTGDLCKDIEAAAERLGITVRAEASPCLELCPLPWERSMLIDPDGKGHEAYFDDLPALLTPWKGR
jgi:hypothetical protein